MKRVRSSPWLLAASLAALVLSASCLRPSPQRGTPQPVSTSAGISYVSVRDRRRTTIHVQPDDVVVWQHEHRSPSGVATSVELRWKSRQPLATTLYEAMYELTGRRDGAMGVREGANAWRALRVASGEQVTALDPSARPTDVLLALEQHLLRALDVAQSERYQVRLPVSASAQGIAACHTADRAPFRVVVVANADTGDYHEQVRDETRDRCARDALAELRGAVANTGLPRAAGAMQHGGRIEVWRDGDAAAARQDDVWPEVPESATELPGPRRLQHFEAPFMPPRVQRFLLQPAAKPERGDLRELALRLHLFGPRYYSEPRRLWRATLRTDQSARIAWQYWSSSPDHFAIELAFETQPDSALVSSLFEQARSLRLIERKRWFCGETNIEVRSAGDDERMPDETAFSPRSTEHDPSCVRISQITKQLRVLLHEELIGAAIEQAVAPVVLGLRDCQLNNLDAASAVLEWAQPTARPVIQTLDDQAPDPAAANGCLRAAISGFKVPAQVRELWHAGTLRVVAARRGGSDEIKGIIDPRPLQQVYSEVPRAPYKTRW